MTDVRTRARIIDVRGTKETLNIKDRETVKGYEMIKSGRELAIALDGGKTIDAAIVSKRLARIVNLWASRKEIIIANGKITGSF